MMLNLQQHARRFLAHSNRTRFFSSTTNQTLPSPTKNLSLLSRIEAASDQKAAISTVLEQWRSQQQYEGNKLNPSLVRGIVQNLQNSKLYPQALEVSNWMIEQKICDLIPDDFTSRFHLIANVSGLEEAEKFFDSIPENQRSESMYTALLNRTATSGSLGKAEATFEKMRELGLLLKTCPYNSMLSLYSRQGNRYKVDEILREMKENNVEFDSVTVNSAVRVYAIVSDVKRMEKFLSDWQWIATIEWLTTLEMAKAYLREGSKEKARKMLRRIERSMWSESCEKVGLMRLYGEAGARQDVYRIWDMLKSKDNEGYRALIGSLLKLDDISRAEDMFKEWECSSLEFDSQIPTMLVSYYRGKGMESKADKLMDKTMRNARFVKPITSLLEEKASHVNPRELRVLIKELRDAKQFSKALEASEWIGEKKLFSLFPEDYATRLYLIDTVLGTKEAEKFFKTSIPKHMVDYSVYTALLASYTRSSLTLEAETTFKKMRELGFLTKLSPYSLMISLYSEQGKESKIKNLLEEMKRNNIESDNETMNNVLRVKAEESTIKSMERYKKECEEEDDDGNFKLEMRTREAMAKAYETVGLIAKAIEITRSAKDIRRLWDQYNIRNTEGYVCVIRSLLKVDDVQGAEEIYNEWKSSGLKYDARIASLIVSHYCEEKEYDAEKALEVVQYSRPSCVAIGIAKLKRLFYGPPIIKN